MIFRGSELIYIFFYNNGTEEVAIVIEKFFRGLGAEKVVADPRQGPRYARLGWHHNRSDICELHVVSSKRELWRNSQS